MRVRNTAVNDNNTISIDIRVGNPVRIRRTWRSPNVRRLGVVSAIEPNDPYGMYVIEFEDGLQFRYERHELEPTQAAYYQERAVRKLLRLGRLLIRRLGSSQPCSGRRRIPARHG